MKNLQEDCKEFLKQLKFISEEDCGGGRDGGCGGASCGCGCGCGVCCACGCGGGGYSHPKDASVVTMTHASSS